MWVLALAALLVVFGGVAMLWASGFAAYRQASAAADLAALAAATQSVVNQAAACAAAAEAARVNHGSLLSCQLEGSSVLVVVGVEPGAPWLPTMRVEARAGFP